MQGNNKGNQKANRQPGATGTDAQEVKKQIQKDVSQGEGAMTSREAGAMND